VSIDREKKKSKNGQHTPKKQKIDHSTPIPTMPHKKVSYQAVNTYQLSANFKTKSGHTSKKSKHKQQSLTGNEEGRSQKTYNADYGSNSTTTLVRQDPTKI
jgi:hypothetical protein